MINPGNCIGENMKVFKILKYSRSNESSMLSEKLKSSEENLGS